MSDVAGAALPVIGYIPVALIFSEGAGSVLAVVWLTGAHLYTQALGNREPNGCVRARHTFAYAAYPSYATCVRIPGRGRPTATFPILTALP